MTGSGHFPHGGDYQLVRTTAAGTASASTSHNSFTDLTEISHNNSKKRHSVAAAVELNLNLNHDDQDNNSSNSESGGTDGGYHETSLHHLRQHLIPSSKSSDNNKVMALSPPTPFADTFLSGKSGKKSSSPSSTLEDLQHFTTLRKPNLKQQHQQTRKSCHTNTSTSARQCRTMPRKGAKASRLAALSPQDSITEEGGSGRSILPPPPQYKGVHFAPGVAEGSADPPPIPTEGLPTRPAAAAPARTLASSTESGGNIVIIPAAETVPITVNSQPSAVIKPKMQTSSSMTFNGPGSRLRSPPPPESGQNCDNKSSKGNKSGAPPKPPTRGGSKASSAATARGVGDGEVKFESTREQRLNSTSDTGPML